MNLVINTTTLSGTGVTQVAVSFIYECIGFPENIYHVFLSKTVSKEIDVYDFPDNFHFYQFENHPLYGLKGFSVRKQLRKLEKLINPDIVFSVFGPSCWTPQTKHVTGFANSYYVYPESPFFKKISFKDVLRINLMKIAHRFFLKRNGKYFICETDDMSKRLSAFLDISKSDIFTVSNTYNRYFEENAISSKKHLLPVPEENEYRFLSLASFDIHKNLTIINEIVPILNDRKLGKNVKFVLTVDPDKYERYFSDEAKAKIINLGRVDVKDCPQLYSECNALFLPTLIESFSANYPEAMKMGVPILTSHYSFAKSICENAALYFDPLDAKDIQSKIEDIITNENLSELLIENGKQRIKAFGNAEIRAKRYLDVFKSI
ncbi:glycosyltransferase [Chryseobacterium oryctis]|uniref:Glycosyltransferase n=1 Tax=Chryseobacterium oryctis TaxID=2952618 RepID=A0ABT3HJB1_9FLAO|nr:glycosyltransferase [Chryseobacterium oryctis]MCW3159869.1 glycosyltransferase [Chryseobacterium oryctis]